MDASYSPQKKRAMSIKSDFKKGNHPTASIAMQHYIFAFVQDVINQPNNLDRSKAWLKEYSKNEHLNYSELEYNLNVFFELLAEYSETKSPLLYRFLKLQAQTCYINEDRFNLLRISYPYHDFMVEIIKSSACYLGKNCVSSSPGSGIVGGHIIGL
jgi:hypothetical protein